MSNATTLEGLAAFNALSAADAERELLTCCASRAFARHVAALRPYRDLAQLTAAADSAVRELDWPDVLEALGAHPRIGERRAGADRESSWSRQEQSGVQDHVRAELAEGNRAYEARFGHVYLICATGLTGEEMLARLRERLGNDEEAERAVVRDELAKITRLRMAKLLGGGA
ncbi:2-oxo-4-hydroxy-4-carboxy-5-ureidoimidazoline decarboxylase [Thermoactinospora rubra]|uniref:2-oxo-4-hydroxy-4-carboxy-5-ureidoimidazoline decarboxylase n=1 Tax=Thermoactinospora rubra TaxID=1088767 RepID=UPI000A11EEE3|nr:2-oxo-4-hydroxy-4-carboxy-5-ureidoimidazoline decarboxylase [Thermoactinospora rubra]